MEEVQNEYTLVIKRENVRTTFITEQGQADLLARANITESQQRKHPLTMLAEDEMTKANLETTRFAIQIICTSKGTGKKKTGDDTQHKEQQNSGNGTNQSHTAEDMTLPLIQEPMATLTSLSGMKFMVPEVFMEFCENLVQENKTLGTRGPSQGTSSSTRMDEDRAKQKREHIRLQDTYSCNYPVNSTQEKASTPQAPNRSQLSLANRNRAWRRGEYSREQKSLRTSELVELMIRL